MQSHLESVNTKVSLTEKDIISMLWKSYILFLHVDRVSITNNRNLTYENVSLVFLIILN